MAVSVFWALFQTVAHLGAVVCNCHAGHYDRNRPPRRSDQSPRDPRGDGDTADRSSSRHIDRHRIADQPDDLVRALADSAFLWILPDIRDGLRGRAAGVWLLEIRAVCGRAPAAAAGMSGR